MNHHLRDAFHYLQRARASLRLARQQSLEPLTSEIYAVSQSLDGPAEALKKLDEKENHTWQPK